MKERERILDLVKKGILSSEEALVLLENLATEKDEKQIEKVANQVDSTKVKSENSDPAIDLVKHLENDETLEQEDKISEEKIEEKKLQDKEQLEKILDELATQANKASAELDGVNTEIDDIKDNVAEKQEKIMELNTKEELDTLSEEELNLRKELEKDLQALEEELSGKEQEKDQLEEEMKTIRKAQWSETKEKLASKLDIPEDWKEQATETMNNVGEKMTEAGSQLGSFIKKTFNAFSETVNDNVEWRDVSFKVPGVATSKFTHEFNYPSPKASLIDVKVANGNVIFKSWEEDDVKIDASIKLYGKMAGDSPLEAFLERSQIDIDDESISVQIPNKRVRADLTFYLPSRVYDHVAIKLLNGNVLIENLHAKDVYTKSTNGSLTFENIDATMLEIEGVNGDIKVLSGEILDTVIETVNGIVTVMTTPQNISTSVINGNIKMTFKETTLRKIEASSVNGNIKIALPEELGVDGTVKTGLGAINTRVSEFEVIREKKDRANRLLQFRRVNSENMAQVNASTTTGNIYLKDTDK